MKYKCNVCGKVSDEPGTCCGEEMVECEDTEESSCSCCGPAKTEE